MKSSRRSAKREERRKIITVLAIALPLLLLLGLVVWSFTRWQVRQAAQRMPVGAMRFERISEAIDLGDKERALRRILELHELNMSGGAGLNGLQSFQVSGSFVIGEDEREVPFILTKKAPNRLRLRISSDGADFLRGHNGRTTWSAVMRDGRLMQSQERTGAEAREIARHADFTGFLHRPEEKGWTLELAGVTEFEGTPCYEIHGVNTSGERVRSLLDAETFMERHRVSWIEDEGVTEEEEARFIDYFVVDGFSFPARVESFRSGAWVQSQEITEVEVNIGVFDWFFEMPELPAPQGG